VTFATPSRLLLSAYQCGPGMGSVSKIGWEWYSRLAPRVPTTLVTHIRNQEALAKAGAPLACSEVIFVDTKRLAEPLYRLGTKLLPGSQRAESWISSLDFFVYDRCAVPCCTSGSQRGRGGISSTPSHLSRPPPQLGCIASAPRWFSAR
jgi:hypothetical protein